MPSHENEVQNLKYNYSNIKTKVVGYPLYLSSELCKQAMAYTLGFQWLMPTLEAIDIPYIKIKLPTFTYIAGNPGYFAPRGTHQWAMHAMGLTDKNQLVSSFAFTWNQYRLNGVNFLLIGLNYIARNLGKAIGVLAVSPFTIPAFIAIKSYFSIKIGIENVRNFFSTDNQINEQHTIGNNEPEREIKIDATTSITQDPPTIHAPLFPDADGITEQSLSKSGNYTLGGQ
ncbi:hypothetical protein [Legionella geestiana]|nr:hypothetical protein [Legionella geestiana]QBS11357.1 hypothetical protein E4T54_00605 [Legionella geestiana]QDQ38910.1 hypothetical protein E3226_000085 [Legionella geestiana]